ncbi:hypothetical protein Lepto782_16470 [Leptospira interrogans serovar Canicola]|uniref:Uncharacterized protein n=1 Tax=Leptospira interrogans serovar Canicola TaxID=211880 RepID=A0AAP9WG83_LEPIR|nr:hypothetical protein Lepto782_16470 [Leptospira interrogans serovar Canicola]
MCFFEPSDSKILFNLWVRLWLSYGSRCRSDLKFIRFASTLSQQIFLLYRTSSLTSSYWMNFHFSLKLL